MELVIFNSLYLNGVIIRSKGRRKKDVYLLPIGSHTKRLIAKGHFVAEFKNSSFVLTFFGKGDTPDIVIPLVAVKNFLSKQNSNSRR